MADFEKAPRSYQLKALIRKNAALQVSAKCTLICQVAIPLILVLCMGIIQLYVNYVFSTFSGQTIRQRHPELVEPLTEPKNFVAFANPSGNDEIGSLHVNGTGTGLLGHVSQRHGYPYFKEFLSRKSMLNYILKQQDEFLTKLVTNGDKDAVPIPISAVVFRDFDSSGPAINFSVAAQTLFPYPNFELYDEIVLSTTVMLIEATLRFATNDDNITLSVSTQALPYKAIPPRLDIGSFLAALFYPFALSFLLPVFMYNIVLEKQEKLREMMKMMGLKMRNYWAVTYLYDWLLYLAIALIVVVLSLAFGFAVVRQGIGPVLFFFGLWGHVLICFAFFLSALFGRTRTATIFGYLLVVLGVIIALVLNAVVFKIGQEHPAWWYFLVPPWPFYRVVYDLGILCGVELCPSFSDVFDPHGPLNGELFTLFMAMLFESFALLLLALYLDAVLPKEWGLRRHPLFPLFALRQLLCGPRQRRVDAGASSINSGEHVALLVKKPPPTGDDADDDAAAAETVADEDDDVATERQRVYQQRYPADAMVIIVDMHKRYDDGKVAVRNVTLAIPRNECFGLLGPNGAGKTTTIGMLTGLFPPTSGYARIGGFDIRDEIHLVHRIMGVCPQFDVLWPSLTCEQTLLFYARLKGVDSDHERPHVQAALAQVGLDGAAARRRVAELSGGMRRRLSIAVALVGEPRVVFLDEPTTGLDPESRRMLWDVLLRVKTGRSMILTTHSMEEAEVLCDRIGIMAAGALKCLGTQQHLKAKFGEGYTLKLNFNPDCEADALGFVTRMLPTAKLVEKFIGSAAFQIPARGVVVSELFTVMEAEKANHGIVDWGISQTSLEDVFLNIVKAEESPAATPTS